MLRRRYQVPQAGNCFPQEASFLAASSGRAADQTHDGFERILAAGACEGSSAVQTPAWRRWVDLRSSHVTEKIRPGSAIEVGTERPWRPARGEDYRVPMVQHALEGDLEFRGRVMAVHKQQQDDARRRRQRRKQAARL